MPVPDEQVRVSLSDGTDRLLSLANLRSAGTELDAAGRTDLNPDEDAVLDGVYHHPLNLVSAALKVSPDLLRPAEARRALEHVQRFCPNDLVLGWEVFDPSASEPSDTSAEPDPDAALFADLADDFPPRTLRALRHHRGNWVAVRAGDLIAAEPELAALLKRTGDEPATVLYVPTREQGSI